MTLHAFCNPRVAFSTLEAGVVCSGRAVFENLYIHGKCLFREAYQSELDRCTAVNYLTVSLS